MLDLDFKTLLINVDNHVATVTLNRPEKKNALTGQMVNELLWAFDTAKDDPEIRVIVLRGAGGTFCAGADLAGMASADGGFKKKGEFDDLLIRFEQIGKPVVAAVDGYAMGGGVGLVAACHFSIGARSAVLAAPEINRGVFPMMIMAVLQRVMPQRKLLELMLLGDRISAEQAMSYGLLSEVVDDAEFEARVLALGTTLAAKSPTAMRMGLLAYEHQRGKPSKEALPYLREQLFALLATEDAREGLAAFFQKRPPVWKGK